MFFFMVFVRALFQHINIISINHKLMCDIQFQPLLNCLNLSGEIF